MSDSPLAEASPLSLDEIFAKDPLSLTDDDIARTVSELRSMRERWVVAERKGKPKAQVVTDISIEDLGL